MTTIKKNVTVFNSDVEANQGYKYTTNTKFSSVVSNLRLTNITLESIPAGVKSLIDIGCGDGTYTYELYKARTDLTIAATDPATKAVELAKQNYSNIDFFPSNILVPESFANRHYDMAVIRGVLHHLSDPKKAIENTLDLVNYMLIIEPNGNNPVLKYIEKHSAYHVEHEEQSFTTSQLKNWCGDAGWQISSIQYVGFVPFFFPTFLSKMIYFFQPFMEKIPMLRFYLSGQIVILCQKNKNGKR
ncbi:MAG: class I SAM-dependent methyltransferase [Bacteroidota bacterium]